MRWWAPAVMMLGVMTCGGAGDSGGWAFIGCMMFWFALTFGYRSD